MSSLERVIDNFKQYQTPLVLIINPKEGDLKDNNETILKQINEYSSGYEQFYLGYIIDLNTKIEVIRQFLDDNLNNNIAIIHDSYDKPKELVAILQNYTNVKNIFF